MGSSVDVGAQRADHRDRHHSGHAGTHLRGDEEDRADDTRAPHDRIASERLLRRFNEIATLNLPTRLPQPRQHDDPREETGDEG